MRPWLVQKFGGTSVGKLPGAIADIVDSYEKDWRVVVVCSARSSNVKAEGTTARLLKAIEQAQSRYQNYRKEIRDIREDHIKAAVDTLGSDSPYFDDLVETINTECDEATRILEASRVLDEVSSRTMDIVLSIGERISCQFMAAVIKSTGRDAKVLDLTRIVNLPSAGFAADQKFYNHMSKQMAEAVHELGDAIPVATGFFGLLPGGLIKRVGRGYTDLCAALLAVGLNAKELQIWKEVDGVFTADPRKVTSARLLDEITPEEAAELTYYGSEVIHPFTMDHVIHNRIPIRIKNVWSPEGAGTRIFPPYSDVTGLESHPHPADDEPRGYVGMPKSFKGPTAVTSKGNMTVLNITSNKTTRSHGFLARVFTIMDKHALVVDLVSTSEVHISMAIHTEDGNVPWDDVVQELQNFGSVEVKRGLSIVSLIGTQMKQYVGIAGRMFTIMADAGVNLEMISQGASEINISCVVSNSDVANGVRWLHDNLLIRPYSDDSL